MKKLATSVIVVIVSAATMLGLVELGRADTPVVQIAQASGAPDTSEHPYRPLVAQAGSADAPRTGPVIIPPPDAPATETSTVSAPAPAPATTAPTVPDPEADAGGFFRELLNAARSGKWKVFAGLVLVGLVYVTRRWVLGKVKWAQTKLGGITLALGMSLAGTFGLALSTGAAITFGVVFDALSTAVAAAGLWQWLQSAKAPKA